MKQKKRVFNFILALVCCLSVFLNSGLESSAEEGLTVGTFMHNGVEYNYYKVETFEDSMYEYIFNYPAYGFILNINGSLHACFVSYDNYCIRQKLKSNGSISFIWNQATTRGYKITGVLGFKSGLTFPVQNGDASVIETFLAYFNSDDFDDLSRFIPDFDDYYHEDTDIWIKDMRAELQDDVLYATWNGLDGTGVHMLEGYENTYVQVLLNFVDDKDTVEIEDDSYFSPDLFYTELPLNEFSVAMSEFEIPEGYRLQFMIAAPYWYFNDDVNSTMFKGKVTYMFFDENGKSDYPLIKNPEDIYNPLDPNLSNWNAITNFTGDYFYNMNNVMNSTLNSWDGSGMASDNERLNGSISSFIQEEKVIFDSISGRLNGFEFDNYLSFGDKVTNGISFGSMLINKFFEESGDFTILFVVGCVMVFVFIVVGIWRFSK